jgi:glycosyltransferase involved in cell wall biosynthesis
VIATSEQERDEMISTGIDPAKIVQRRNGVDLSEYAQLPPRGLFRRRMGIGENEQIVLYLSRIVSKKSPDLLMLAFAELHQPETRLVIAGPDEGDGYLQQLKALRSQLGLDNAAVCRVLFVGPLYGKEKLSAFVDADIFVLPSQNENFGNVIAEAVAAGTPVVITDRCGIAPYIRNRVGLVVGHNRSELRDAIACLLSDRALRDELKANCRSVAQEFSWDEPVTQMEALYSAFRIPHSAFRQSPHVG